MGVGDGVRFAYYTTPVFRHWFLFSLLIYISYVLGRGKIGHHSSASRGVGERKKRSFFLSPGLRISNKYFICFFHRFSGLWVQKSLRGVNHIMMNTNFFVVTGMEYILMCFVRGDREIIA